MSLEGQMEILRGAHSAVLEVGVIVLSVLAISRVVAHDVQEIISEYFRNNRRK